MTNDDVYANAAHIPGADAFPGRWAAEAAELRAWLGDRSLTGLAYGEGARERFDLFLPEGRPRGTVMFVHGGYWRAFGRDDWSGFAAGPLARGWAVAVPGYTLAPEAGIAGITREIAAALTATAARTEGSLVLTGHSAGGHLVARMLCGDVALDASVAARLARCVPISPVADLRPLVETGMNADFGLTAESAAAESPALMAKARDAPVTIWVGADERPAFLAQARALAEAWRARLHVAPGRHHFDVIDDLLRGDSPLCRMLLDGY